MLWLLVLGSAKAPDVPAVLWDRCTVGSARAVFSVSVGQEAALWAASGHLRGQSLSCSILIEGAGAPSVWPLPIPPQRPVATLNTGHH